MGKDYEEELERRCQELEESFGAFSDDAKEEISKLRDIIKTFFTDINGVNNASRHLKHLHASKERYDCADGHPLDKEVIEFLDKYYESWRDKLVDELSRWQGNKEFPFNAFVAENVSYSPSSYGKYMVECRKITIREREE